MPFLIFDVGILGSRLSKIPRVPGVRIRQSSKADYPNFYNIWPGDKPGIKAIIYAPSRKARRKSKYAVPYSVAHELGHFLAGDVPETVYPPKPRPTTMRDRIRRERDAWAIGVKWVKQQGFKPKLRTLRRILKRSLATYAVGRPELAIGTPKQRGVKSSKRTC